MKSILNTRQLPQTTWLRKPFFVMAFILMVSIFMSGCDLTSPTIAPGGQPADQNLLLTQAAIQVQQTQLALDQAQLALEQTRVAASGLEDQGEIVTLEAETPVPEDLSEPSPTPETNLSSEEKAFSEDFSVDSGRFSLADKITIENGALYMGIFEQCADFNSEKSSGCVSVCLACGDQSAEYEVNVEAVYVEGVSNRSFGLVLRFLDKNGNHLIDQEDYFLGWVFSVNSRRWQLYEHQPDQIKPWRLVTGGRSNLRATPRKPNYLRVVSTKDGQRVDIFMNDTRMARLVTTHPLPGEIYVENMPDHGEIGLWVAQRGVRVLFDNYEFTDQPVEE